LSYAISLAICFFYVVEHKLHQPNHKARVAALFSLVQDYYSRHPEVENKFDNLTPEMLRKDDSATKPPKLRAKAAEARGLVGFAVELAVNVLSDHMAHEHTMKMAARCMRDATRALAKRPFLPQTSLRKIAGGFVHCMWHCRTHSKTLCSE
jgi:hypothetical protein